MDRIRFTQFQLPLLVHRVTHISVNSIHYSREWIGMVWIGTSLKITCQWGVKRNIVTCVLRQTVFVEHMDLSSPYKLSLNLSIRAQYLNNAYAANKYTNISPLIHCRHRLSVSEFTASLRTAGGRKTKANHGDTLFAIAFLRVHICRCWNRSSPSHKLTNTTPGSHSHSQNYAPCSSKSPDYVIQ